MMPSKNKNYISFSDIMEQCFDIVLLNALFILCSLPIITIGASLTALHRVLLQSIRREDSYHVRNFFQAFRREFRQSTILWLIMLTAGVILYLDLTYLVEVMEGLFRSALFFSALIFEAFWLLFLIYLFPLQARYENPVRQTVKNAFLIGIWKLPYTISAALIYLALPAVYMLIPSAQPVVMILYLVCGFSFPLLLADRLIYRAFRETIPEEQDWQNHGQS